MQRDPLAYFTAAAVDAGLIKAGDPLDQNLADFAHKIVELCAVIAEPYGNDDESAADHIRAEVGNN